MPVLRIHFTPDDLSRTRLAPDADLYWETAFSLSRLRNRETARGLGPWPGWARRRLGRWGAPLLAAAPPPERFPDFLDQVRRNDQRELGYALERYHSRVITPFWPVIRTSVASDRARRTGVLLADGLEGLLRDLSPRFRWQAPVLETDHPVERDLHLNGRGLLLLPLYFGAGRSAVLSDLDGPVVLALSIPPSARVLITVDDLHDRRSQFLDALLGSTRAAVLRTLGEGCTTTELARRVGVSASTASQHATVLRDAGLITTQRRGPSVMHLLTALGSAVLQPADPEPDVFGRAG